MSNRTSLFLGITLFGAFVFAVLFFAGMMNFNFNLSEQEMLAKLEIGAIGFMIGSFGILISSIIEPCKPDQ